MKYIHGSVLCLPCCWNHKLKKKESTNHAVQGFNNLNANLRRYTWNLASCSIWWNYAVIAWNVVRHTRPLYKVSRQKLCKNRHNFNHEDKIMRRGVNCKARQVFEVKKQATFKRVYWLRATPGILNAWYWLHNTSYLIIQQAWLVHCIGSEGTPQWYVVILQSIGGAILCMEGRYPCTLDMPMVSHHGPLQMSVCRLPFKLEITFEAGPLTCLSPLSGCLFEITHSSVAWRALGDA